MYIHIYILVLFSMYCHFLGVYILKNKNINKKKDHKIFINNLLDLNGLSKYAKDEADRISFTDVL